LSRIFLSRAPSFCDPSTFIGIENYYAKAAIELGAPGLLIVVELFLAMIRTGFITRRKIIDFGFKCCANALLAFITIIFVNSFKGLQILNNDILAAGYAGENVQPVYRYAAMPLMTDDYQR
jgi:hypothetical protein